MNASTTQSSSQAIIIAVRKDLRFIPQRGESLWRCVIEDTVAKKFYRVGRREYLIASALDGGIDVATALTNLTKNHPELNFDSSVVEQTVKWLLSSGLAKVADAASVSDKVDTGNHGLDSELPIERPIERPIEKSSKSSQAKTSVGDTSSLPIDPFSFRFPLLDGALVEKLARSIGWSGSLPACVAGVVLILAAAVTFSANTSYFVSLGAKLFVPDATAWWAVAWFVLKSIHELGHATICVAHGGTIRSAGIAFFYMAPVPYVDTTDMWRLPSRRSRAFCAAGGMWFELLVACMALIACRWFESPSLQYFCIALATLGTFTTIAFNANPLVRFDGYYILSDILDRPTLWNEGQAAWKSIFSGHSFMLSSAVSLHGLPLVLYGFGCFANRWLMMIGMAWGTWHTWRGIGLILIGLAIYLWFVSPYLKRQGMLRAAGQKAFQLPSMQKMGIVAGSLGLLSFASIYLPSPWQPQVPGIVAYGDPSILRPACDGLVMEVFVNDNEFVEAGRPIVRLENPILELQRATGALQRTASQERCLVLRAQHKIAEMQAEQAKVDSLTEQLAQLDQQVKQLIMTAPISGRLIARKLSKQLGQFLKTGQAIGMIVPSNELQITCSVSQQDVDLYRQNIDQPAAIYLQSVGRIVGKVKEVTPRGQDTLDSPILAAKYGGPIAVHMISTSTGGKKDPLRTEKPRFSAIISVDQAAIGVLSPGQLCRVQLMESKITVANAVNRWIEAFINWIKPPQVT